MSRQRANVAELSLALFAASMNTEHDIEEKRNERSESEGVRADT